MTNLEELLAEDATEESDDFEIVHSEKSDLLSRILSVIEIDSDSEEKVSQIINSYQNDQNLQTQMYKDQIAKAEYQLSEAKLAMKKLKKDLNETLGAHNADDDKEEVNDLFKKLQYQLAEERMEKVRQRRQSIQLKEDMAKINYELADERIQHIELKQSIQEILEVDVNELQNMDKMRSLIVELQKQLDIEYHDALSLPTAQESEMQKIAKADEQITKVDMEQSLANIQDTDNEDIGYEDINDVEQLKKIIKSLKAELVLSRTDQLAVSETKSVLEVQTFDLESKLSVEKTKYKKLLRASQQMQGFDPSMFGNPENDDSDDNDVDDKDNDGNESVHSVHVNEEVEHMEAYSEINQLKEEIKLKDAKIHELSKKSPIAIDDDKESEIDDNASVNSVNVKEDVEHTETYSEMKKLKEEIMVKEAEILSLQKEVDELSKKHKKHKRRESEVYDMIGDDAKNIVMQLEELEESKKKAEDAELTLQFLKADKQRTDIALDHAKRNVNKYRAEANELKRKIKELETHRPRPSAMSTLEAKVVVLEKQVEEASGNELKISFLEAEKKRMEVALDFQTKQKQEAKAKVKAVQKEVEQQKEKVRRMSKSLGIGDEDEIKDIVAKTVAADNLEETVKTLKTENEELRKRLYSVEQTQVNKLLAYVGTGDDENGKIPPPPPPKRVHDDDEDDDDESDASVLSGNGADGDNEDEDEDVEDMPILEKVEDLRFKLANAELQNAQLKRRVSIAGIEKEALSLLWDTPRVTIQMVSEFIERLPLKHKEKIWARHATGNYIAKNKILHTLHSFVALCIKIKDRTAVAPSRHDIEKKLIPYAEVIRTRCENANGMSLDEFNNDLHFWILEPVSGLIMTNDEQKQWLDEIDALREELIKTQKDKLRIQRKSQMDLTVLLDKMKGFENNPNDIALKDEQIEELQEHIDELHEIVNNLQDEAKENKLEIKRISEENFQLRKGRDKSRLSEDDEENEDNDDDDSESEEAPQLIDESQKKRLSEFKKLQSEEEFSEERMEYYQNDSNITKSQAYIGWKQKALESQQKMETLERERKASTEVYNEQIGKLKQTVEELKTTKASQKEEIAKHESHVEQYKTEIEKFKKKHQESEKVRRQSISDLHDNLLAKLVEAEADHEEVLAEHKQTIGKLLNENKELSATKDAMEISKLDTLKTAANTIQELRESVAALSKKCQMLTQKNRELSSRTAWDSLSSWMG